MISYNISQQHAPDISFHFPLSQYPEYVIKNQYRQLVNDEAVAKMREHVPKCQELISHCNKDQVWMDSWRSSSIVCLTW
jgi:hypothetical protein